MAHFIHHIGLFVSDFEASERFYTAALAPLGIIQGLDAGDTAAEYWHGDADTPSLAFDPPPDDTFVTKGVHVASGTDARDEVDAFYTAAIEAGGVSRYEPRFWPEYRAYCAFVSDPDGNNIEALHKETGG